ncbi:hypothetical protein N0V82_006984 [Gnomoniopsis sp. IMI 355080]|nr:hypothetical protein N0V82_006984 [Gnomoniopsis sp. IMI 355080]
MFDDIEKDETYEAGAPAGRLVIPVGTAYTTSKWKRERTIEEPEEGLGGKTVHVLGFDPKAYFIAHCLAGYEYLNPVKLLIHKRAIWNTWEREGKRLLLLQGASRILHDRAEAEWIGTGYMARSNEHIEQLVVTIPCHQTREAIENIQHRIDHRTTICLVQDGLGVVEELNATLFVDPTTRPTYIIGHSTAYIGHYRPAFFAAMLRNPGKLYLTPMERGVGLPFFSYHPPIERRVHGVKFLRTLVGTHGLGAGGFSLENYLVKKLPEMVFQSIIEPMAISLDTTYDKVLRNQHAILLADELLEELFNVIWALPELNNSHKVVKYCGMDALRKHTVNRLANKGNSHSPYLAHVRAGRMVDIDYLNGYFVRRGQELGIKTSRNEMITEVVKARVASRRQQLKGLVPFEGLSTTPTPGPGNQNDE